MPKTRMNTLAPNIQRNGFFGSFWSNIGSFWHVLGRSVFYNYSWKILLSEALSCNFAVLNSERFQSL